MAPSAPSKTQGTNGASAHGRSTVRAKPQNPEAPKEHTDGYATAAYGTCTIL